MLKNVVLVACLAAVFSGAFGGSLKNSTHKTATQSEVKFGFDKKAANNSAAKQAPQNVKTKFDLNNSSNAALKDKALQSRGQSVVTNVSHNSTRQEANGFLAHLAKPFHASFEPLQNCEKHDFLSGFDIQEFFHLSTLYQNYFLPVTYTKHIPDDGRRRSETKFQISVKKALVSSLTPFNETWYFGYTQTSWWQIFAASAPFRENNYAPELFVNFPTTQKWREGANWAILRSLRGVQFGFIHESNGRDEEESRSWNRVYLSAHFSNNNFDVLPKIWLRIPDKHDDNPHILHYKGSAELLLHYRIGRQILGARLISNLHFDQTIKGAVELEWAFPIFTSGFYCYTQYYSGYGESMIDYNRHINRIGIGFLLLQ